MSYDLGVFHSTVPLDAAAAAHLYVQLCEGTDDGSVATSLIVSPALDIFYRALVARFPEIDDDEDDSPFACSIEHTDRWVIMNVSFSRAEEVAAFVKALAKTHGLDCYNPQENRLMAARDPLAVPRPTPTPRLPPREGRRRFVAGIDPKLHALGFAMVRPTREAGAAPRGRKSRKSLARK